MQLTYMLKDESYKYVYGSHVVIDQEPSQPLPKQYCCRNDWAVAQLVLRADVDMQVNVSHEAAFYPKGGIDEIRVAVDVPGIHPSQVKAQLVGLIRDDDHQYKSDLLMDEVIFLLNLAKSKPYGFRLIWIKMSYQACIKHASKCTARTSLKMNHSLVRLHLN